MSLDRCRQDAERTLDFCISDLTEIARRHVPEQEVLGLVVTMLLGEACGIYAGLGHLSGRVTTPAEFAGVAAAVAQAAFPPPLPSSLVSH